MAFNVEPSPTVGPHGDKKYVVDHDRSVWLQRVSNYLQDSFHLAYQLHWGDRMFLLESNLVEVSKTHGEIKIEPFGVSYLGAKEGLASDSFRDENDRAEVAKLAAEALLIYGMSYDGYRAAPGFWRVTIDGHRYDSHDFK